MEQRSASELGIVSLFNGIGGLRRAFEMLEMPVRMYVSVELEANRRRVCKVAYPHVRHYKDVRAIGRKEVEEWRDSFPSVRVVIAGGRFPCRDMSQLRGACRLGVQGPQSGLVIHLPSI